MLLSLSNPEHKHESTDSHIHNNTSCDSVNRIFQASNIIACGDHITLLSLDVVANVRSQGSNVDQCQRLQL